MSDEKRPVWSTQEFRDYISGLAVELQRDNEDHEKGQWGGIGHLYAFLAAWDAAPADAEQVVRDALIMSTDLPADERRLATANVLRALGHHA